MKIYSRVLLILLSVSLLTITTNHIYAAPADAEVKAKTEVQTNDFDKKDQSDKAQKENSETKLSEEEKIALVQETETSSFAHENERIPYKAEKEKKWFLTTYQGKATSNRLNRIMRFDVEYVDYYVTTLAVGKEVYLKDDLWVFEVEGHFAQHYNHQNYGEVNLVGVFRWLKFPWDRYIDTSIGLGEGLSYAFEDSELEALTHSETTKFLNFLKFDLIMSLPNYDRWSFFGQIYHRSGVFGTFNGVEGASNILGVGIRYNF